MMLELSRILREAGLSQESIGRYVDEYKAAEAEIHRSYGPREESATKAWLEESDSLENGYHDRLGKKSSEDRMGRRNLWQQYNALNQHSWIERQLALNRLNTEVRTRKMELLSGILQRAISTLGEEAEKRNLDGEERLYFWPGHKLVAFDVDGTLVDSSGFLYVWYNLNEVFGTADEGWEFQKRYMDGKITYQEWVDSILSLYVQRGANRERLYKAIETIEPMQGAHETLQELRERGKKVAVISGSLNIVLQKAFPDFPFDYVEINEIYFDESGNITGWKATPYGDGKYKALGLMDIADREGISLSDCVFVGDSDNDRFAVEAAGLGIAFNPAQDLEEHCDVELTKWPGKNDLRRILRYIL